MTLRDGALQVNTSAHKNTRAGVSDLNCVLACLCVVPREQLRGGDKRCPSTAAAVGRKKENAEETKVRAGECGVREEAEAKIKRRSGAQHERVSDSNAEKPAAEPGRCTRSNLRRRGRGGGQGRSAEWVSSFAHLPNIKYATLAFVWLGWACVSVRRAPSILFLSSLPSAVRLACVPPPCIARVLDLLCGFLPLPVSLPGCAWVSSTFLITSVRLWWKSWLGCAFLFSLPGAGCTPRPNDSLLTTSSRVFLVFCDFPFRSYLPLPPYLLFFFICVSFSVPPLSSPCVYKWAHRWSPSPLPPLLSFRPPSFSISPSESRVSALFFFLHCFLRAFNVRSTSLLRFLLLLVVFVFPPFFF